MKIGDQLMCKKNYKKLKTNEIYSIISIKRSYVEIDNYFFTENEKNAPYENYIWFYFYTIEEIRKKKLNSL